jgi:hypothetical protein
MLEALLKQVNLFWSLIFIADNFRASFLERDGSARFFLSDFYGSVIRKGQILRLKVFGLFLYSEVIRSICGFPAVDTAEIQDSSSFSELYKCVSPCISLWFKLLWPCHLRRLVAHSYPLCLLILSHLLSTDSGFFAVLFFIDFSLSRPLLDWCMENIGFVYPACLW